MPEPYTTEQIEKIAEAPWAFASADIATAIRQQAAEIRALQDVASKKVDAENDR